MTPSSNLTAALCEIIAEVRERPEIPATQASRWIFDTVLVDLSTQLKATRSATGGAR